MPSRYYFNRANGDEMIRDDGVDVPDLRTALIHAFEAIEELRREDTSPMSEWHGWSLEAVDSLGNLIQRLPLDGAAPDKNSRH